MFGEEKKRIIQEYVPGKQVTLAHVLANPDPGLAERLGLRGGQAIGVMTITPGEAAIIAADVAVKASRVEIGFVDRFSGSLLIVGQLSGVRAALYEAQQFLKTRLGFQTAEVTSS